MKANAWIAISLGIAICALLSQHGCGGSNLSMTGGSHAVGSECPPPTIPFPSYADDYGPPEWWCRENKKNPEQFPIFQLSQDLRAGSYREYLQHPCPSDECKWQSIDFKTNQEDYLRALVSYAFEGNLAIDWLVEKNAKRKWFHAPYMHLDIVDPASPNVIVEKVAREFVHGLTMERTGCLAELVYEISNEAKCAYPPTDPEKDFQSWAVSFYNDRGASYLGHVWNEIRSPSGTDWPQFPSEGFPEGSVALKLLFTEAPPSKVSYLENSFEWQADTADMVRETTAGTKRMKEREKASNPSSCQNQPGHCLHTLRLLQIDIAVRDRRSPVGWVFSTFTYDKDARPFIKYDFPQDVPVDRLSKLAAWLRIKPLGLTFGNDPGKLKGHELQETVLNRRLGIPQHYGCGDAVDPMKRRLNGPVDNPASSCVSCHAQAETPKNLRIENVPYGDMKCEDTGAFNIDYWFKNINPRDTANPTFTSSTYERPMLSFDYSLQMREGVRRYCVESYAAGKGKNVCNLSFVTGEKYTVVTKQGTRTFTVR